MPDLTPDQLARLRIAAAAAKAAQGKALGVEPDVVLGLLDEIEQLRGIIRKVTANGGIGTLDRGEMQTWSAVVATESERVE